MCSFADVLARSYGGHISSVAGAGAAGGLGAAVITLFGGTLKSGIDCLLDAAQFDPLLSHCDLVITGEGRIDWQSAHGKVPMGVGLRAKAAGVPCIALCGSMGNQAEEVYSCGIDAIFSAIPAPLSFAEISATCGADLAFLTDSVFRLLTLRHGKTK